MRKNAKSAYEGTAAEQEFISLRGDNFIRKATKEENIFEHWDILDKEFGHVDVKAAKRKYRHGPVDNTIWWELRTVKRPPEWKSVDGWGVPNDVARYIAVKAEDFFYLVNPETIINIVRDKCVDYFRGEWGLHTRPNRGDLMTILPLDFIQEHAKYEVKYV